MIGIQISGKQALDRWAKIIDILQIQACQIVVHPSAFAQPKTRYHFQSLFEQLKKNHLLQKIFIHVPDHTAINGAARHQRIRSFRILRRLLESCEDMGIDGLIVHVDLRRPVNLKNLADEIPTVFFDSMIKTPLLLENTAYPKDSFGCSLSLMGELSELLHQWTPTKICLDSAHLFAAGYVFDSRETAFELKNLYPVFFEQVAMLHLNDSKEPFGSFKDRHEHIGYGCIGLGALGALLSLFSQDLPLIMEPPSTPFEELIASVERLKKLLIANAKKPELGPSSSSIPWIF